MSIKSELSVLKTNIQNAKNKLYTNLVNKGVKDITTTSTLDAMADSVSDIVTGGGGSSEGGNPFEAIGYDEPPQFIQEGITTAKNIYDNWDNSLRTLDEKIFSGTNITFFPSVDTSNVTKLWMTFNNQRNMLYFPHIDTSNMQQMYAIFAGCKNLLEVDLSNWDTRNVTNISEMFYSCTSLKELDLNNWNTSSCTNMSSMFYGCSSLATLNISNWNTEKVTNMSYMFSGCTSLKELDLNNWNTSSCTNMSDMFNNCSGLTSLNISNWNTEKVTNIGNMFRNCSGLTSLDLSGWDVSNVTNVNYIFQSNGIKSLNLGNWKLSKVSSVNYLNSMFQSNSSLIELNWNNFGEGEKHTSSSFSYCKSLGVNTSDFPNARQVLTSTFVTNSFDRATAGYSSCKITFNSTTKALFTTDEIAQITAKGFTIA